MTDATKLLAAALQDKLSECDDNYDIDEFLHNYRNLLNKLYDIPLPEPPND